MLTLVANTVLMSVQERVREFGVLRTLGFTESYVAAVVVLRVARALARRRRCSGSRVAFVIVKTSNLAIGAEGVPVSFDLSPMLAAKGAALAMTIGIVSGLFPAVRSARAPIVSALRSAMMGRRLPFDYAVRNLGRRRLRTVLTGISAALVAALLVATAAFVRGLEGSFAGAAQDDCAILLVQRLERDVVRSTVGAQVPELVAGSVPGVLRGPRQAGGVGRDPHGDAAPLGPAPAPGAVDPERAGFVRGVTDAAFLVHEAVTLTEGAPPGTGEVIVGRLVARQLGVPEEDLVVGKKVRFEGGEFTISGRFAAPGTTTEAEIWAPLVELRGLTRRDDSSIVFVRMESPDFTELDLFAKRRLDLELIMIPSATYYRELSDYFEPIRKMAWALAAIMGFAALFGGANTLNAAVQDRLRELAMLAGARVHGVRPRALARDRGVRPLGGRRASRPRRRANPARRQHRPHRDERVRAQGGRRRRSWRASQASSFLPFWGRPPRPRKSSGSRSPPR